jgi:hypothetical protein
LKGTIYLGLVLQLNHALGKEPPRGENLQYQVHRIEKLERTGKLHRLSNSYIGMTTTLWGPSQAGKTLDLFQVVHEKRLCGDG